MSAWNRKLQERWCFLSRNRVRRIQDISQNKQYDKWGNSKVKNSDFVGSTSQLIKYITEELDPEQKVVVGTEFNMVNRLREKNTYILSSTKPECPTMNETTLEDVYNTLKSIENETYENEIFIDDEVQEYAKIALERMFTV